MLYFIPGSGPSIFSRHALTTTVLLVAQEDLPCVFEVCAPGYCEILRPTLVIVSARARIPVGEEAGLFTFPSHEIQKRKSPTVTSCKPPAPHKLPPFSSKPYLRILSPFAASSVAPSLSLMQPFFCYVSLLVILSSPSANPFYNVAPAHGDDRQFSYFCALQLKKVASFLFF